MSAISSTVSPPTSPKRSPGRLHLRAPLQKLARRVSHLDFHRHRREESEEQQPEHKRSASASYIEPVSPAPVAVAPSLKVSEERRSLESESSSSGGEDKVSAPVPVLVPEEEEEEEDEAKLRPVLHEFEYGEEASTRTIPDYNSSRYETQHDAPQAEEYDEEDEKEELEQAVSDVVEEDPHTEAIEQAEDRVEEAIAKGSDATAPMPTVLSEEGDVSSNLEPLPGAVECAGEVSAQSVPQSETSCDEPQPDSPPTEEHSEDEKEEAVELGQEVFQEEVQEEPIKEIEVHAEETVVEVVEEEPKGTLEAAENDEEEKVVGNDEEEGQLVADESAQVSADPARVEEHEEMPNTAALISSPWPVPPQEPLATSEQPLAFEDTVCDVELPAVAEEISHAPEVDLEEEAREQPADDAIIALERPLEPTPGMEAKTPSPVPDAPVVEPEVPDPFIVDDPEEPTDEPEQQATPLAADDVPLSEAAPPAEAPQPPSSSESDQDEEEAPDLYLPELVLPTMFLPIPNADPLTTLLNKYIYPPDKRPARDLSGDWHKADFHTLVMTNSWRALARMARDRLVAADPEDLTLVLGLWYLRLSALARLRLFNQTAAECTNLFNVLDAVDPPSARAWLMDRILPFELEVMRARLRYWAGDPMGYTDALAGLLTKCKVKARLTSRRDEASIEMWKERGARIALILASQMVETKDFTAATRLLEPLAKSAPLRSAVGRIYLQAGDLAAAERHFRAVAEDGEADEAQKETNEAVMAAAKGEWARADEVLRGLLEREQDNYSAINNLAVAMLAQGKLKDAIAVLEKALHAAPATIAVAEPFLFNLSTLYELRSASAVNNKRELLITVARFSGDGLRTTCLKMPTS